MIARHLVLGLIVLAGCDGSPVPTEDAGRDGEDAGQGDPDGGRDAEVDAGPGPAPIFRNEDERDDDAVARDALRTMGLPQFGGNPARCVACHQVDAAQIREWRDLSSAAWSACFSDLAPASRAASAAIIDCFEDESGAYDPAKLGVFSTGAYFDWFAYVFRTGGPPDWEEEHQAFQNAAAMPPATHPRLSQSEFDTLTEWFLRGVPRLDELLRPTDPVGTCTSYTTAAIETIVDQGETDSWSTRNREAGLLMHDCAGAGTPRDCLASYPRASTIEGADDWETPAGTQMRVLFEVPYRSQYWTRSSVDGRFVGHGGSNVGTGAAVIDLERRVVIGVEAAYDPGFFPDNSGFVFQPGEHVCEQSVLLAGSPTRIDFRESGCIRASFDLYEHVGASLDGGDYWVVDTPSGAWEIDNGDMLEDPGPLTVTTTNEVAFHQLTNTGSGFERGGDFTIRTPYETNHVLSPSGRLMAMQVADSTGTNIGYVLHRVDVTREAGAVTEILLPEIGRYCVQGGKPAFSLDDRWLITHHRADDSDAVDLGFTGPDDPGFAAYRGVSNVYLIDLRSGETTRITNMQPGQQALFPHFRSDGWIYILVRTAGLPEYVVASDAALVLGAP